MRHRMEKSMEIVKQQFSSVRTGRASVSVLDHLRVEYYESAMPISQVASVNVMDAKTLEIKPWDVSILGEIEKAIMKANLGVTPQNDGKMIRLVFPPLTEERRREFVKQVNKMAEDGRIEIRNHRRKAMDGLKSLTKDKHISEDEEKQSQGSIQKITDDFIAEIDGITKSKEKELLSI
jgi:ribosome recycling factor